MEGLVHVILLLVLHAIMLLVDPKAYMTEVHTEKVLIVIDREQPETNGCNMMVRLKSAISVIFSLKKTKCSFPYSHSLLASTHGSATFLSGLINIFMFRPSIFINLLHYCPCSTYADCYLFLRLIGKVALVTGGASGIGESIVRLFHLHGAKVCLVDVQDNLGLQVAKSLGGDSNVCFFHCDVTVEDDVRSAVDFTVENFGTLDIIVNNAGIAGSPCPDIRNADMSEFERVFNINVKGVFHGMKHAARIMIPLKKGSVISLSSVSSTIGGLGPHAYTGSKHAIWGLTKNVAAELGQHGIRVNCVAPYAVFTSLSLAHLPEEERTDDAVVGFRKFIGGNANLQGVELTANDVANAVLFLASDDSGYVSGQNLMVDGGFTSVNHSLRVFR